MRCTEIYDSLYIESNLTECTQNMNYRWAQMNN